MLVQFIALNISVTNLKIYLIIKYQKLFFFIINFLVLNLSLKLNYKIQNNYL